MLSWEKQNAPSFEVIQGDLFLHEWENADMIFCNSTCFPEEMMEQIYQKSLKCQKGTWFVTMSKKLPHARPYRENMPDNSTSHWDHIRSISLQMSWGIATANLHLKRS